MEEKEWDQEIPNNNKNEITNILRISISGILGLIGILIILSQIIPITKSFVQGRALQAPTGTILKPVPDSYKQYIQGEFAYNKPGGEYFYKLTKKAEEHYSSRIFPLEEEQKEIIINTEYKKDMALSIDSIGINRVNISSNVESQDENVYNQYLTRGLAHFKGTPLPGDHGNSFIYGHSAVTSFFNSHPDLPETIFTRLEKVDIGDIVKIYRDNKELQYTVRKKKIVDAHDFGIFEHKSRKETVTLMTCWPVGIGTKRLIVIGELNES